jgi:hypothetical protein
MARQLHQPLLLFFFKPCKMGTAASASLPLQRFWA